VCGGNCTCSSQAKIAPSFACISPIRNHIDVRAIRVSIPFNKVSGVIEL
jgi:hypothetical protein